MATADHINALLKPPLSKRTTTECRPQSTAAPGTEFAAIGQSRGKTARSIRRRGMPRGEHGPRGA
ncbi:hypothetical protein CNY67_02490 [Desulfovibrio sp. G11]|nr:hypothetical protein CNY67_02490 [Desulfovibrio sp. G11]